MNPAGYIVGALLLLLTLSGNAMVWPVHGVVTSTFHDPDRPTHNGIDIAAPVGTPIVSPLGGVVSSVYYDERGGNSLLVELDGPGAMRAGFAHLSAYAVTEGESVARGQLLGYVGETGNARGAHLHFTLKRGNDYVDPLDYLPAIA